MTNESIRKLRKQLDLTQSAFASVLGVARETIARWETGENKPMKVFRDLMDNTELMMKRAQRYKQEHVR